MGVGFQVMATHKTLTLAVKMTHFVAGAAAGDIVQCFVIIAIMRIKMLACIHAADICFEYANYHY